jgi:thiosulfate dehydrogenase
MTRTTTFLVSTVLFAALGACAQDNAKPAAAPAPPPSSAPAPPSSVDTVSGSPTQQAAPVSGNINVLLCDGKTTVNVPPGTPPTSIAGSLMQEWLAKNPDSHWEAEEREKHALQPAADNADLVGHQAIQGPTYGAVTTRDVILWKDETERMALAGSAVFHSGDELGSTIGVSCDMCHPHAANTHPETYPKFQAQLGRVVLLRDMINWCIEHPVRGKPLASDDPKMRALEAYIIAQRKGRTLDYGKH